MTNSPTLVGGKLLEVLRESVSQRRGNTGWRYLKDVWEKTESSLVGLSGDGEAVGWWRIERGSDERDEVLSTSGGAMELPGVEGFDV